MRVKEWIEQSRAEILPYSEKEPRFGTLQEELKELHLELTYTCNFKCRMCDTLEQIQARAENCAPGNVQQRNSAVYPAVKTIAGYSFISAVGR